MTTQPKLPEWAEQLISERKVRGFDLDPDTFHLTTEDARALASRLMAEIVPEGCVVIPAKQLADLKHIAAYVGLAAVNTPLVPVYQIMADAMRDIPDPGPAAEPCKTCGDTKEIYTGDGIERTVGDIEPCPDCSPKQAEGGGKSCKCGDGGEICQRGFTGGLQGMTDVCINSLNDGTICGHSVECHEGAKP